MSMVFYMFIVISPQKFRICWASGQGGSSGHKVLLDTELLAAQSFWTLWASGRELFSGRSSLKPVRLGPPIPEVSDTVWWAELECLTLRMPVGTASSSPLEQYGFLHKFLNIIFYRQELNKICSFTKSSQILSLAVQLLWPSEDFIHQTPG